MFFKKLRAIILILIFYQTTSYSKSVSFNDFSSRNVSKYFSGIIAQENNQNVEALNFFNSSKILIDKHEPYLKKYIYSLVLENKISEAINILKRNKKRKNSNFFDAHLILLIDNLKKNDFNKAHSQLMELSNFANQDRLNLAILESLKQYIYVFKEKKILVKKKDFGKLSNISETFQRCYIGDKLTDEYFSNLFNDTEGDYTRYVYFYLSYLVENNRLADAKKIVKDIDYLNSTLLLSQGKNWIENGNESKLVTFFSCKNHNDIISEFLFLISNLYSSQDNFEKSNFYLNLSNFLNPKFIFNLSLIAENQYFNNEYEKAKKTLKNFKRDDIFYYWFRVKKEAQILTEQEGIEESLKYILNAFNKIDKPNNKMLFDIANFYKNSKVYNEAIKFYTKIIEKLDNDDLDLKSDLLYRRGGSYERLGKYENADDDLLSALNIEPDDAYVLNYLAYSWLERNHKINEAIIMLEKAYSLKSDDPYIIDSIGWAYYLIEDFLKAERFMKRAVELMPDDPIVNDHYGDILWKLDRKIQARYFWKSVLKMNNVEDDMIDKINLKITKGLEKS